MKLAEALILRADYQRRYAQLTQRIMRNARIQEGDEPAEDPQTLLSESERLAAEIQRLIQQINLTNSRTQLGGDGTLSDAIATRDVLKLRQAVFRDLASSASNVQARSTRSEIKYISTINVTEVQARADDLARQHRELDSRLQEANWLTDLIEERQ